MSSIIQVFQCSSTFLQPEETVAFPVALQAKQGNMPPSDHIIIVLRELFLMPRTVFYFILIKLKIVSLPVLSRVQLFLSLRSPSPAHGLSLAGRPSLAGPHSRTGLGRERPCNLDSCTGLGCVLCARRVPCQRFWKSHPSSSFTFTPGASEGEQEPTHSVSFSVIQ